MIAIRIPEIPSMDNDRLFNFCIYNPGLKIVRNHKGKPLLMAPTRGETGNRNYFLNGIILAQMKMQEWMENGVHLAWLLDPYKKKSYVYRQNREVEIVSGMGILNEDYVLLNIEFDLSGIYWEI